MLIRRQALLLAVLTGFCGLGSESVYLKLLDFSIGSAPLVAYAVVATFIAGVGVGSLLSPRVRRPWIVEAVLGVYHLGVVSLLPELLRLNSSALTLFMPILGPNLAPAALGVLYLLLPTLLLGVTFPALIERSEDTASAYVCQAAGALTGIVAIEAWLYPRWGLNGGLLVVAALHLVAAVLLFSRGEYRFPATPIGRISLPLLAVGAGTGAFQGVWLLLAALLFHPFYFIQPIVIGTFLAGIFVGPLAWRRFPVSFERVLYGVVGGIGISTGLVSVWVHLPLPQSLPAVVLQLPLLLLPASAPIGAVFPAYLAKRRIQRREAGAALLSLSMGNAAGVLLAGAVLLPHLTPVLCIAAATAPAAFVLWRSGGAPWRPWLLLAGVGGFALVVDEAKLIKRSRTDHVRVSVEKVFRGPGELSAIYSALRQSPWSELSRTERRLYLSGFAPFVIEADASLLQEAAAAALAVASSPRLERALVLGAGSGRAAGFVAQAFEHTDVVDIGATVPEILRELHRENYELLETPGVRYHAMDAILAPDFFQGRRYDLVFNTVNPVYVSLSAKLYTLEYIRALKTLLTPDGIFVTWSDTSVSPEANQILINTAGAPFAHQRLLSVLPGWHFGYYLMIQSDQRIGYRLHGALLETPLGGEPAVQSLKTSLGQRWIRSRAHPTMERHTFSRPAPAILFAGYPDLGNY